MLIVDQLYRFNASAIYETVFFSFTSLSTFLCFGKFKGKALFAEYNADLSRVSESKLKADPSVKFRT